MLDQISQPGFVADVKCYYCGHVSGQVVGSRNEPLRLSNFRPRPGYAGPPVRPGTRLRCERCNGPVFLEDLGPAGLTDLESEAARERAARRRAVRPQKSAPEAA